MRYCCISMHRASSIATKLRPAANRQWTAARDPQIATHQPRAPIGNVSDLLQRVRDADIDSLVRVETQEDGTERRASLDTLVDELLEALPAVADGLNHAYLVHAIPRRQARGTHWGLS